MTEKKPGVEAARLIREGWTEGDCHHAIVGAVASWKQWQKDLMEKRTPVSLAQVKVAREELVRSLTTYALTIATLRGWGPVRNCSGGKI